MGEKSHKYFSTREFAKICGVKKQTLFHYDDIGLFKPEITTDKGYRYYAYQQVEMFNVIELLKELSEVTKFIHNCKEQSLYIGHPIGAIIQREQFVTGDYDNYSYLYTKVLTSASDNNLFEKPADLYAIGYHKGDSDKFTYRMNVS